MVRKLLLFVLSAVLLAGCAPLYYLTHPWVMFRNNTNINGALPIAAETQLKTVDLVTALGGPDMANAPSCYGMVAREAPVDYFDAIFFASLPSSAYDTSDCLQLAYRAFYGEYPPPSSAPSAPAIRYASPTYYLSSTHPGRPPATATLAPTPMPNTGSATSPGATPTPVSGAFVAGLKLRRNRVQEQLISASNQQCAQFTQHLNSYQAYTNLFLGILATGSGAAGAIVPQTLIARSLSGSAGALSGFRAEFDADIFAKQLASVVTKQINDGRLEYLENLRPCESSAGGAASDRADIGSMKAEEATAGRKAKLAEEYAKHARAEADQTKTEEARNTAEQSEKRAKRATAVARRAAAAVGRAEALATFAEAEGALARARSETRSATAPTEEEAAKKHVEEAIDSKANAAANLATADLNVASAEKELALAERTLADDAVAEAENALRGATTDAAKAKAEEGKAQALSDKAKAEQSLAAAAKSVEDVLSGKTSEITALATPTRGDTTKCGKQALSIEEYSVEAAVADALTYNDLCSLRAGLEHLSLTTNVMDTVGLEYLSRSLTTLKAVQTNLNALNPSPAASPAANPTAAK